MSVTDESGALEEGALIGNYEVIKTLREGGMATLYLGLRESVAGFRRHVAIKAIHPDLARDPLFTQMFVDEALLSARIQHPHVVHVEELLELQGHYYLIMEFVPGCSLAELIAELERRGRRFSPVLAAGLALRVAEGLHAAHETRDDLGNVLGVVHRDISPQNILIAFAGYVKLIDFGIAKARTQSLRTGVGVLKGKYRYMSPEQARGLPVDRRSDIYSLGVVLWEMLALRALHEGDSAAEILAQVQRTELPPPSHYCSDIPPELDRVVLKCLEKSVEKRPRTAYALSQELARALPPALAVEATQVSQLLHALMPSAVETTMAILREVKAPPSTGRSHRLSIATGPQRGKALVLGGSEATWSVGRSPEATLVLEDLDVSRLHFEVTETAQGFTVQDLGSKNGICVNGERVTSAVLKPNDRIEVGGIELIFESVINTVAEQDAAALQDLLGGSK